MYAALRERDPVHRSPGGFWVLSRFADVHRATCAPEVFSSASGLTFTNEVEALDLLPTIVMMDPPDQTRYRRLVNRGFSPRSVAPLEPEVRAYTRQLVDELCEAGSGDFASGIARLVPAWLVARYLGVPEEDRHLFDRWTEAIVQNNAGAPGETPAALGELYGYFVELVGYRRRHPGDDMVSDLLRADAEGRGIGLEGILGYAFVMVAGGNDTTTGLLTVSAELLTERLDQRERLLEDPGLMKSAVEELLRVTTPVQGLCRVLTADTEVRDVVMRAGDRVLLCYAAANRDVREFGPDADDLVVDRPVRRHLTFSSGPHHCLGAAAARLMGRVVLEELLRRCPDFRVDASAGSFADGSVTRRYDHLPLTCRAA